MWVAVTSVLSAFPGGSFISNCNNLSVSLPNAKSSKDC